MMREMFVRVFEYTAAPGRRRLFEAAYGPNGEWVRLFRDADGYVETTLWSHAEGQYRTQDVWSSEEAFTRFLERNREAYARLDEQCGPLKAGERHIGDFDAVMPATGPWRLTG